VRQAVNSAVFGSGQKTTTDGMFSADLRDVAAHDLFEEEITAIARLLFSCVITWHTLDRKNH
jgi:hypothetical protein